MTEPSRLISSDRVAGGRGMPPARAPSGARREQAASASVANRRIAARLDEVAMLLEQQGANSFHVRAWRRAAEVVRRHPEPMATVLQREGAQGLVALPAIGDTLARAIRDLVERGRLPMLDRLRGDIDPEALLRTVPGVGRVLAGRLHAELGIDALEELEAAAHDGRLADLGAFGRKRIEGIRDALAARLQRRPVTSGSPAADEPPVRELLDVDREYRRKAAAGELSRIAPRRFNPGGEAWLAILHTTRGGRRYTALFSNTARAHQLSRTRDWVVIYADGAGAEHRYTVVTEREGQLAGRRVVRGRESECARWATASAAQSSG